MRLDEGSRNEISFDSGGLRCAGWWYVPDGDGPHPAIALAHGFAGVREGRLDAYAERFCDAGIAALVFDYRHFGASEGEPRQLLDIDRQLGDWRAALAWIRARPDVDHSRVGVWGTSFSGGHVLTIAAEERELAAAVAQVPFADGLLNSRDVEPRHALRLLGAALRDEVRSLRGSEPLLVPAVGPPGSLAAMTSPDAEPGYKALIPAGSAWRNEVAARIFTRMSRYRPGRSAERIDCPLLVCVGTEDVVTPAEPAVDAAHAAPRGEVLAYPIEHFDAYRGEPFERIVSDQVEFLKRTLIEAARPARRRSWIDGRAVLITGAARGVGAGLARGLAERGAQVAMVGIEPELMEATAAALGDNVACWEADVTDAEALAAAVEAAVDRFGRLDAAIANAGITAFGSVESLEPAAFRKVIDVNVTGAWLTLRAALPHVVRRGGYLMSIVSTGAFVHSPMQAHYAGSKAALHAITDSLRIEMRGTGTRVGGAYMTFIDTDMMSDALDDPAGRLVWGGNEPSSSFGMISLDEAVAGILAGFDRRARETLVPAKLKPVALMPGIFQRLAETKFPVPRTRAAVRAASPSGWSVDRARDRYGFGARG